ncbi:MAG: hypothetical protein A3K10_15690 [Bacteroidetes bacterium RIFCSPLOWO2_12_FULL_31_6]|nr:MAG: hypothetical protein A3K10_15690 [Bacteroidetes bacterium RIFCSPLOWO2_12_FULL_31_6]
MSKPDIKKSTSFTLKSNNGRLRELITECGISLPFNPQIGQKPLAIFPTKSLWDTGATGCVITKEVANKMGLKPISKAQVNHAGGTSIHNVYLVSLFLPNNISISQIRITECDDVSGKFGFIIGMDVITNGDFSITNIDNKTTFSFRMPSIKEINYVKEGIEAKTGVKSKSNYTPPKKKRK